MSEWPNNQQFEFSDDDVFMYFKYQGACTDENGANIAASLTFKVKQGRGMDYGGKTEDRCSLRLFFAPQGMVLRSWKPPSCETLRREHGEVGFISPEES